MMKKVLLVLTFSLAFVCTRAQAPAVYNSADILARMEKLKVLGSVLYVAAHPDDENTRLLAWLSRDRQYRTGYLSITRGDGGQNLIGEEQGVALGLIRTQELLAARRIDGAEQFFTRAYDFGFSKSTDEALKVWNKEKILGDVVWVIRRFRPDVIITRFPEDSRAGHGHHSGSAVLAREAFAAAADPSRYPEQLKNGVTAWKAKRIFWNTFNFGNNNTISPDQFKIDVGNYNPLLGKGYGELAAESRSQHKSQGFGVPSQRGSSFEYFVLTGGDPVRDSLMDGVDIRWSRVPGAGSIENKVDAMIASYSFTDPSSSLKSLIALYKDINALPDSYWKNKKLAEVQELIAACTGLYLEASTTQPYAVQGDSLRVNFFAINRSNANVQLKNVRLEDFDTSFNQSLLRHKGTTALKQLYVSQAKDISQPYWLKKNMEKGSFNIDEQGMIGKPENDPSFQARFQVEIEGLELAFDKAVMYKHTDPVKGELFQPLAVVPPISVNTSPGIMLFRKNQPATKNYIVSATAYTNIKPAPATIHNRSARSEDDMKDLEIALNKGVTKNFQMPYTNKDMKADLDVINSRIEYKNQQLDQANYLALATINYDHIPPIKYFYPDGITVLNLDIKTAGKRVGYIKGAGDKVPEALEQLGYEVTYLGEGEIKDEVLSKFDVVVMGVRAYNVHEWLVGAYEVLMNYVKNGGVMVVQYNTNSFVGTLRAGKIGPYDFTISNGRVTDEESAVKFETPSSPMLNWPNKITETDFSGWVQERGIYFADKWSPEYQAVLGMRDAGEPEDRKGSLLMANYGKGRFVYTGLAFFRQLPSGVPGAYRLFANIIANPNYKK